MPVHNDVVHQAATHLRGLFSKLEKSVSVSHSHELTAAYMGFNSKKALLDSDEYDLTDPDLVLRLNPDINKLGEKVEKLRPDLLQKLPLTQIAAVIKAGLTPPCECCHLHLTALVPITSPTHQGVDGWVCWHCVDRDRSEEMYATCRYCGDETVYRARHINRAGECPEHAGESAMDPEEEADFNDWAEWWSNR